MKHISIIGLAALVLAGCGGGGGDTDNAAQISAAAATAAGAAVAASTSNPSTPTPASTTYLPEGIWQENTFPGSSGAYLSLFMLDSGESWGVVSSSGQVTRVIYGNTSANGVIFSGNGRIFDTLQHTIKPVTYTGSVDAAKTIQLRLNDNSLYSPTRVLNYDLPTSVAALSGTFNGAALTGETAPISFQARISSSGTVDMSISAACSAAGTIKPNANGKAILDLKLTFTGTGTGCALGNGTAIHGMAYYDIVHRQVVIMGMNSANTDGFIYVGIK